MTQSWSRNLLRAGWNVEWHFVESQISSLRRKSLHRKWITSSKVDHFVESGSLRRKWITLSNITSSKMWSKVIALMETFDEVMDGQIFDQLYRFRRSEIRRSDLFPIFCRHFIFSVFRIRLKRSKNRFCRSKHIFLNLFQKLIASVLVLTNIITWLYFQS